MDVSSLVHEMPEDQRRQSTRTQAILTLVDETIRSVRRIATELRQGMLDDLGLVATIEWAGEEFGARTGTQCRLDLPPDDIVVDPDTAVAIFRIFQETLTNVARHANAKEVQARLAIENGNLTLEVHDNGSGIPPEAQPHIFTVPFFTTKGGSGTGLGLVISHRIVVERHHGKIDFSTGPDGTQFNVRLPFESPAHA